MVDGNRDSKKRFSKRGRYHHDASKEAEKEVRPLVNCAICGNQIFDLSSALNSKDGKGPVHFDCALAKVSETETLAANEKIVYVGKGNFAVIEYRDKSLSSFNIKRRIPWEKEGETVEWRKDLDWLS